MRLSIATLVGKDYQGVNAEFNQALLQRLSPPFPKVSILRYDGNKIGDEVHLQLDFLLFKQEWTSLITENQQSSAAYGFVDEGINLPFFLSAWKHGHWLVKKGTQTEIRDDIHFQTPWWLPEGLVYPLLFLQFAYRKPIYRKVFGKPLPQVHPATVWQ
jgi:ligand-binding SRPBCC domain-containing protein